MIVGSEMKGKTTSGRDFKQKIGVKVYGTFLKYSLTENFVPSKCGPQSIEQFEQT